MNELLRVSNKDIFQKPKPLSSDLAFKSHVQAINDLVQVSDPSILTPGIIQAYGINLYKFIIENPDRRPDEALRKKLILDESKAKISGLTPIGIEMEFPSRFLGLNFHELDNFFSALSFPNNNHNLSSAPNLSEYWEISTSPTNSSESQSHIIDALMALSFFPKLKGDLDLSGIPFLKDSTSKENLHRFISEYITKQLFSMHINLEIPNNFDYKDIHNSQYINILLGSLALAYTTQSRLEYEGIRLLKDKKPIDNHPNKFRLELRPFEVSKDHRELLKSTQVLFSLMFGTIRYNTIEDQLNLLNNLMDQLNTVYSKNDISISREELGRFLQLQTNIEDLTYNPNLINDLRITLNYFSELVYPEAPGNFSVLEAAR